MKLKSDLFLLGQTAYVSIVVVGFSYLIGMATEADILLLAAIPLGVLLVALLFWLPPRIQLVAWAAATAWLLSSVYLGQSDLEYIALVAIFVASLAGVFWSPWVIAATWLIHPLWDLIPRDLPEHQHDLPLACLMYDLVVAIYLVYRIRSGYFKSAVAEEPSAKGWFSKGYGRTVAALLMLAVVVLEITVVGFVSMESFSVWVAPLVALALIGSTLWLPNAGKKLFWAFFTGWTGMTFAHSGDPSEIAIFGVMILLAVLGYRRSMFFWLGAWVFHAIWHLIPREHLGHEAALLMGHWMVPLAGLVFELTIAAYITFWLLSTNRKPQV